MATEVTISDSPENSTLQKWFRPLIEHGSTFCASNLQTTPAFLRTPRVELPLSVNEAEWDNSWICSPWNHYITYAAEEIDRATGKVTSRIASEVLRGIGAWFRRAELNRVVMVNNWLLSTNSWPPWEAGELREVIAALVDRWPDHAIVFRSLNPKESTPLMEELTRVRASLIPSRQVWWYEANSNAVARSRDVRKDISLLNRGDLEIVPNESIQPSDFPALTKLYNHLYLEKYSRHNPQFTGQWLAHLHREDLIRFTALRNPDGEFAGVEGCFVSHGIVTSPLVGYDLTLPHQLGLYRRLAVMPILEARRLGLPLNLSAGVGRYKSLRGGEPVMEYLGLYDRHLPLSRRLPWQCIQQLSSKLLAPYVRSRRL